MSSLSGRLSQSRQTSHPFYPGRNPSEILERESFSGRDAPRLSHNPDLTVVAGSEIIISNLGRSDVLVGVGGQGVPQAGGKIGRMVAVNIILESHGVRHSPLNCVTHCVTLDMIVYSSLFSPELPGPQSQSRAMSARV